jgi:hypothetical protein
MKIGKKRKNGKKKRKTSKRKNGRVKSVTSTFCAISLTSIFDMLLFLLSRFMFINN